MSLNGVWSLEIAGMYGWERVSTVFLEDGRYLGGGATHFSQGCYTVDKKKIKMKIHMIQHGLQKRTVFGERRSDLYTEISGKREGDTIQGKARLKDAKSDAPKYTIRLVRQMDLIPIKE